MLKKPILTALIATALTASAIVPSAVASGYGRDYGGGYHNNLAPKPGGSFFNFRKRSSGGYGVKSRQHVDWCFGRYNSYRASDNSFKPYNGPRKPCLSPYFKG